MATREETRAALVESIAHWRENEALQAYPACGVPPIFGRDCRLCAIFNPEEGREDAMACTGCPVFDKTRYTQCRQTPWWRVYGIWEVGGPLDLFREAAKDERKFLESLLVEFDAKETA